MKMSRVYIKLLNIHVDFWFHRLYLLCLHTITCTCIAFCFLFTLQIALSLVRSLLFLCSVRSSPTPGDPMENLYQFQYVCCVVPETFNCQSSSLHDVIQSSSSWVSSSFSRCVLPSTIALSSKFSALLIYPKFQFNFQKYP